MLKFIRTDNENLDFRCLVKLLDEDLKVTDGEEHDFYNQFNSIINIKHVILAYAEETLVGCGAIKHNSKSAIEIKRMFVIDSQRGRGIASQLLIHLEKWARELGYVKSILETGSRQHSAIALYKKNGYTVIEKYDQYKGVENSICFGKEL